MRTYYEMCGQILADADHDRYLATLYASAEQRPALFAVLAFGLEIARIRDVAREAMPGEIRLQWWREVLHGERGEQALANPVSAALLDTIKAYDLPLSPFDRLIDAHTFDLYDDPMPSISALETYAEETLGGALSVSAGILGCRDAQVASIICAVACAQVFAGVISNFGRQARRRQMFVPVEVLDHFGAKPEDAQAGNATDAWRAALAEMRLRARHYLDGAEELRLTAPPALSPLLLPATLIRPLLQRMEGCGYDPFAQIDWPQWRRQWRLWRAARNPAKIFS